MSPIEERIKSLITENEVVLFMKGNRRAPQCGFSSTVVDILDDFLDEYATIDVLSDPTIREGVKTFSDWPTIPQLYVRGAFVGGADIIKDMKASGELEKLFGAGQKPVHTPELVLSDAAVAAVRKHYDGDGTPRLRLEIDRQYQAALYFDDPKDDDIVMQDAALTLLVDRQTARRADGVTIDWVETPQGAGFRIENPNAPPRVRPLSPAEFDRMRKDGKPVEVFDVRTPEERSIASLPGTRLLDADGRAYLESLDRDTPVVMHCHHGMRSQAAAEHSLRMGFREVYNLTGGIDAWSMEIDPDVPRY